MNSIYVMLQDFTHKAISVRLPIENPTPTLALEFSAFLAEHSTAQVIAYGIEIETSTDNWSDGHYDCVAQRLAFSFQNKDTGEFRRLDLPAPCDADVTFDQQAETDCIDAVKLFLENMFDCHLIYKNSGLLSHLPSI
jgi:hypothetical protein